MKTSKFKLSVLWWDHCWCWRILVAKWNYKVLHSGIVVLIPVQQPEWNVAPNSQHTTLILTLIDLHAFISGMGLISSSKQIPQLSFIPNRLRSLTPYRSPVGLLWSAVRCLWRGGRTFGHWCHTPPRIHLPSLQAPPGCICCFHSDTAKVAVETLYMRSSLP